jgi:hypothetical protein
MIRYCLIHFYFYDFQLRYTNSSPYRMNAKRLSVLVINVDIQVCLLTIWMTKLEFNSQPNIYHFLSTSWAKIVHTRSSKNFFCRLCWLRDGKLGCTTTGMVVQTNVRIRAKRFNSEARTPVDFTLRDYWTFALNLYLRGRYQTEYGLLSSFENSERRSV